MNIHEYQAKRILKNYNINVLKGYVISNKEEIEIMSRKIESDVAVIKVQIHAGGRGKAGGVKLVKTLTEAIEVSKKLLGKKIITHQTGKEGRVVRKLYIEEGCDIKNEYYLSFVFDRNTSQIVIIASIEGGMDIEEVAKKTPEKIINLHIDQCIGITDYQIREVVNIFNLSFDLYEEIKKILKGLYKCYIDNDCNLIEINPLVLTNENEIIALDAKMSFDDNSLYRNKNIELLRDIYEEDEKEIEAAKYGLSYISLDGSIACMVNGAGLAMATMDSIKYSGGSPANFLDVGGSASVENVSNAFRIILSDKNVKGIFVNIFGGIMKCDTVAMGILKATNKIESNIPIVVRLEGTNEIEGKNILNRSCLNIHLANSMDEGSKLIVELLKEMGC